MDAIRSQYEQIVIRSEFHPGPFRLRYHKLLHFIVTKGPTHTELAVDALVEDAAVRCLDSQPFIWPVRLMLVVQLVPCTVLAGQSSD